MLWVALSIVAVLIVLAALAGTGRARQASRGPARGTSRRRPAPRPPGATTRPSRGARPSSPPSSRTTRGGTRSGAATDERTGPQPGEIWWADVPYEDGPGHKVRPCVVLRTYHGGAEVLKITSQDRSDRSDHVEIPTRTWDPSADHNSFLDLTGPVRVPSASFDDRAGTLDPRVWRQVCRLHEISPN
ncbi:type II toxin-antitoxin system PemK/MazF family toxin [Microbispora sp. H10949]|uniref:type II toxin-antitoxin system PemK/MazF family toxin n=1 Tax=Microbispora sp. H10949 TaxID=2729111 RepID=UPI0016019013|nr:type II toxin-antitoxin system PemK/MazF family toxin [Microbispora sp. H10949]